MTDDWRDQIDLALASFIHAEMTIHQLIEQHVDDRAVRRVALARLSRGAAEIVDGVTTAYPTRQSGYFSQIAKSFRDLADAFADQPQ